MGLNKKHSSCCGDCGNGVGVLNMVTGEATYKKLPNPDPNNFKVIDHKQYSNYLYVEVQYPDCTNFEGRKILVYRNMTVLQFMNMNTLDPHFQNDKTSPIARFAPTAQGRLLAMRMCESNL